MYLGLFQNFVDDKGNIYIYIYILLVGREGGEFVIENVSLGSLTAFVL